VACLDTSTTVHVRTPCGHCYDIPCITKLFQSAVHDGSIFPPHCCYRKIPLESVRPFLTPDLIGRLIAKEKESKTVNKVYCSRLTCSRYLGPRSKDTIMDCPASDCPTRTCGWCKVEVAFTGLTSHTCTDDGGVDQQLLTVSRYEGWIRCPGCGEMIELDKGCYHVRCRCNTNFCYLCGAIWKTCSCISVLDPGLGRAVEARVSRLHGAANVRNHVLVREAIFHICSLHDCGHVGWKHCWGRFRVCQTCFRRQIWRIFVRR
jgi:hypothetical protein